MYTLVMDKKQEGYAYITYDAPCKTRIKVAEVLLGKDIDSTLIGATCVSIKNMKAIFALIEGHFTK